VSFFRSLEASRAGVLQLGTENDVAVEAELEQHSV
jgi:hypothetical protein